MVFDVLINLEAWVIFRETYSAFNTAFQLDSDTDTSH